MKKIFFSQNIIFLFLFSFVIISFLSAEEKQKTASTINIKDSRTIKSIIVKCARKNDDMDKCLSCHQKNGWLNMKYIHGPLAINECRPCHIKPDNKIIQEAEIDISKNPCNFCHQNDEIKKAHPEISKKEKLNCLTCHNPHASNQEYFLR